MPTGASGIGRQSGPGRPERGPGSHSLGNRAPLLLGGPYYVPAYPPPDSTSSEPGRASFPFAQPPLLGVRLAFAATECGMLCKA